MDLQKPPQENELGAPAMTWQVAGRSLSVSRVRLRMLMALSQRIQDNRLEAFFRIKGRLSPDQAVQVLARICTTDVTERDRSEAMLSPDGGAFLLWKCVHRYHAEVTEDQVIGWADDDPHLVDRLLFGSRLTQLADGDQPGADPTPAGSPPTGSPNSSGAAPAVDSPSTSSSTSNGPSI